MDHLFAPWRIEWVQREDRARSQEDGVDQNGGTDTECVFCSLPQDGDDRSVRIVARSEHAYVLLNNYPYNPGHVMVIPDPHRGDYAAFAGDVIADHAMLKQRTLKAIRDAFDPDGFNTGANLGNGAGGSVPDHFHTHIVPRWTGDTNFMPVIGDTQVIVEALDDTYDRLQSAFAALTDAHQNGSDTAVRVGSGTDS